MSIEQSSDGLKKVQSRTDYLNQYYGNLLPKFIILMARQQSPKKSCNLFVLRKFEATNKLAPTTVDFTAIQKSHHIHLNIFPILNTDHKFYTPCFILQIDQKSCESNEAFQKLKFQEKIQGAQEKPVYLNNSFPTPTTTCCQVCKTSFQDYFRHINQPIHQSLTIKSQGNKLIHEIVSMHGHQNKTKKISKRENQRKDKQVKKVQRNIQKSIFSKTRAHKIKSNEQLPTQEFLGSINNT